MRKTITTAGLAFLLMAGMAQADTLPPPTASYDATATADAGTSHYTAQINAAGPRERITSVVNNAEQTIIVDTTTGNVLLLVPGLNAAVPLNARATGSFDIASLNTMPVTPEGQDTILGLAATRYAVTGDTQDGSFTGHVWDTPSGIILKIDGTATHKGQQIPVKAELANLRIRPQNPLLFVAPAGMKQLPIGLNGLLKGAK
jgi:hypothetical protein